MKIEFKNLSKSYGNQSIFKDLSLNIDNENLLSIIGPSGGGKSTLLRMLGGLESFEGQAFINDSQVPCSGEELFQWRKHTGFLFQQYNLFPHLNVLENITLPLEKIFKMSEKEAKTIALDLLKRFKLECHVKKRPHQLSGGQQQRISLCRSLSFNPDILFLDEPTSALDPEMQYEVFQMIEELKEQGINIILVTHHINFAKKLSHSTLYINHNDFFYGSMDDILKKSQSDPDMPSFLKYQL